MSILFLFMDGVGLGSTNPQYNPFVAAHLPHLSGLLDGASLLSDLPPYVNQRASLLSLDAGLGVPGLPQSASGQAALLTGLNVPGLIGEHYGPKPNPAIIAILQQNNLFTELIRRGRRVAMLNAFPPRYFHGIDSGRRLPGAIAMAARFAGIPLLTIKDLLSGDALSADLTNSGWRESLGFPDMPLLTSEEAGERLAKLSLHNDFSVFEYWLSDVLGHRQELQPSIEMLETFDRMLGSLVRAWTDPSGLIVITSDHGNLEDLSTRRHTGNPVPCLLIGAPEVRSQFAQSLTDLTGFAPAVLRFL